MRFGRWVGVALVSACAAQSHVAASAPDPAAYGREVQEAYARARAATAPFRTLDSVVAAGYAPKVAECLAHEMEGGMGYHHVNRSAMDNKLEVERPEILLYEKRADAMYALNGVEYIAPYRVWSPDSTPLTIMGLDLKRSDGLNLWYLHMWIWNRNSAGLFAVWSPAVSCRS